VALVDASLRIMGAIASIVTFIAAIYKLLLWDIQQILASVEDL
jgi:hypothetical protein